MKVLLQDGATRIRAPGRIGGEPKRTPKRPFNIHQAMQRLREAVRPFAGAALFELAEQGFKSVFEQLVGCIISIRTFDEITVPVAQRFFRAARTPSEAARLSIEEIDELIHGSTFHEAKARSISQIAREAVDKHGGILPCDAQTLLSLPGIGPKCAHLVLGIACGQAHIAVDIHVHRVTNRWGYVRTRTPEQTMKALETELPEEYWVEINHLLVPFGKHICTGARPRCSVCPVLDMCRQVEVLEHR